MGRGVQKRPGVWYNVGVHGGELDSTLEAETVLQAVAPNHHKMGTAINANNNQTALAYAA